jgi:hypothetical protein
MEPGTFDVAEPSQHVETPIQIREFQSLPIKTIRFPDQFAPKEKTNKKQGRANLHFQDWPTDIIGTRHGEDECLWMAGQVFQFIEGGNYISDGAVKIPLLLQENSLTESRDGIHSMTDG